MDRVQVVSEILKKHLPTVANGYRYYIYPEIPEEASKKAYKKLKDALYLNDMVGIYDDTLTHSGKTGIVFMSDGAFFMTLLNKPYYFNYSELNNVKAYDNDTIYFSDGTTESLIITCFEKKRLDTLLLELKHTADSWDDTFFLRERGPVILKKIDISPEQEKKCSAIIHAASAACGGVGAGLAQIPLADTAAITPIQIGMIMGLADVFELHITEGAVKGIIAGAGTSFVGRGISQVLVGWIPGIGNAINTATAAGVTEAVGWLAVKNFAARADAETKKRSYEGMKQGTKAASTHYERKFKEQAAEFINQTRDWKKEQDAFNALIDDYEKYIVELEEKIENEKKKNGNIESLLKELKESKDLYDSLKKMSNE